MNESLFQILIVEDKSVSSLELVAKLEQEHFAVTVLHYNDQGLNFALDQQPNLVLFHLHLSRSLAPKVYQKVRSSTWGMKVPVVFFTDINAVECEWFDKSDMEPAYYLTKGDHTVEQVVRSIRDLLAASVLKQA